MPDKPREFLKLAGLTGMGVAGGRMLKEYKVISVIGIYAYGQIR